MNNQQSPSFSFPDTPPKVAVVGSGYWGKNLVRNYSQLGALEVICDKNETILKQFKTQYPDIETCQAFNQLLIRDDIQAIVIATPAETHFSLAREALLAGKNVYVEKPLVLDEAEAEELICLADKNNLRLMVGHLLQYHPVFVHLRQLTSAGELGRINYIYSHRLNLGKIRREENILWSFAPHDISMILSLANEEPESVLTTGGNYLHKRIADVTTTHLEFPSGLRAHIFVSWLHPFKDQKLVVVGDRKMAVFDDTQPWREKLLIYAHKIKWQNNFPLPAKAEAERPEIPEAEPLRLECEQFLRCILDGVPAITDGREGLRVLKVLKAGQKSLDKHCAKILMKHGVGGKMVADEGPQFPVSTPVDKEKSLFFAHPTSVLDDNVLVGEGTKIWHFSHILSGSRVGERCNIGQNVVVGPEAIIGNGCKVQNNVSVYKGVVLEDDVFCGPSMVFTNVFNPRAHIRRMNEIRPTLVKKGATMGANCTIVCGATIGRYAFIGAGAVVTRDVPDHALIVGNPARQVGWMCECGEKLEPELHCKSCGAGYRQVARIGLIKDGIRPREGESQISHISFIDLKAQQKLVLPAIEQRVRKVLAQGQYIMGPEIKELEGRLSEYVGVKHALTCASGTDALLMALLAYGVGPGDAIFTTPFTFIATAEVISLLGATPVFVDIAPRTFNIDVARLEKAIEALKSCDAAVHPLPCEPVNGNSSSLVPRGIIPVDLFGLPCDYGQIEAVARKYGLFVIEDAAQAFGAEYGSSKACSFGNIGCTSFFPAKPLGCYGDGGAVFTDDDALMAKMESIRVHGKGGDKYDNVRIGLNARMDTLQAAILLPKLDIFPGELEARQHVAEQYSRLLSACPSVVTPFVPRGFKSAWAQYSLLSDHSVQIQAALKAQAIPTAVYYPKPLHLQAAYSALGYRDGDFPVSESVAKRIFSLPMHPYLSDDEMKRIADVIIEKGSISSVPTAPERQF